MLKNNGYMGSGKVINAAIKKYGIENFTRVILEQFVDSAAMFAREKEVVDEEFILREDTYNLRRGGFGGFDHINKLGLNDRTGAVHSEESKLKMGRTNVPVEERQNSSRRMTGEGNIAKRPDVAKKISVALTGVEKTDAHKNNISVSVKKTRKDTPRKPYKLAPGRKYTVERKFSSVECPHCGVVGKLNAMNRWHFDNCRCKK